MDARTFRLRPDYRAPDPPRRFGPADICGGPGVGCLLAKGEPLSAGQTDRKLAAILSADVVGYSRLMAEDETARAAES